jgi:hypothetical protein
MHNTNGSAAVTSVASVDADVGPFPSSQEWRLTLAPAGNVIALSGKSGSDVNNATGRGAPIMTVAPLQGLGHE